MALALASTAALGGCNTLESFFPGSSSARTTTAQGNPQTADAQDPNKIVKLPMAPSDLECPAVEITEGGASARTGGAESSSVRYQFDISDVARECDPRGKDFALKVGVSGKLLLGPAGSPGSYSTSLHVLVKRVLDGKALFEKTYTISANTGGGAQSAFQLVTDPIVLPLTRPELNDDYSIFVGLGGAHAPVERRRRKSAN
jgi:hypothetical protein